MQQRDEPQHTYECTQGLFIAILQAAGSIATVEDGKNLQNLLICLEMLPAALGMLVAFPYTEYKGSGRQHLAYATAQGQVSLHSLSGCASMLHAPQLS